MVFSFAPIFFNDPRLGFGVPGVVLACFPIAVFSGYVTSGLVDNFSAEFAAGRPGLCGQYCGCVLGR